MSRRSRSRANSKAAVSRTHREAARGAAILVLGAAVSCGDGSPPGDHAASATDAPPQWLVEITGERGLSFRHETGATGAKHMPEIMGGGAALFDCDGDGDLDVYLTSGAGRGGAPAPNRLFRQEADGRLVDVTAASGLGDSGYGMGIAIGDLDNDGDPDVYVTNFGPDRLYRNRGDGTFEDITGSAGISSEGWSCSASFFDYDRDGWLDLFITGYVTPLADKSCTDRSGRPDYCNPKAFPPVHDTLLHNEGDGTFRDVSEPAGITSIPPCAGLGVVCADLDGDGWQDVYVANDGYPNQFWKNLGDGTFRDEAVVLGAAFNAQGSAEAGMGVLAADFDNDGHLDLFLTHLGMETNTLYRNLGGPGGFADHSGQSGIAAPSQPFTGFGVAAIDLDLDGNLDLVIGNGRVTREPGSAVDEPWTPYAETNMALRNRGGARFEVLGAAAAEFCEPREISRGMAVGDVDADGDPDLLVASISGAARLYRNDAPRRGRWLLVSAIDPDLHRPAIGARVSVSCGDLRFTRVVHRGSSYLSSSDPRAHFGLGEVDAVDHIVVDWPDGSREQFSVDGLDREITLVRGEGTRLP